MSILQAPTNRVFSQSHRATGLDEIRSFVSANADDLIRIACAAGGHNASAAATDLVETVLEFSAPEEHLRDLLIVVRDGLLNGSGSSGNPLAFGRPDQDAAIRWFGARLDELICG